ncbi:DUF7560 family zinc ribbon protein [Salinigranum halophilum]|jgi:hypothetical protein
MSRRFVFDCPSCDSEIIVDDDIRAEILADGCVMCRTPVDTDSFVRVSQSA